MTDAEKQRVKMLLEQDDDDIIDDNCTEVGLLFVIIKCKFDYIESNINKS